MSNKLTYNDTSHLDDSNRHNMIIPEKMKVLEDRIVDTIDIPNMNIPQIIQKIYPITSNINIFAFINNN